MRRALIPCEDGSGNKLVVTQSDDGDIFVCIIKEDGKGLRDSVRLCTAAGGGYHLNTRVALQKVLDEAIQEGCES